MDPEFLRCSREGPKGAPRDPGRCNPSTGSDGPDIVSEPPGGQEGPKEGGGAPSNRLWRHGCGLTARGGGGAAVKEAPGGISAALHCSKASAGGLAEGGDWLPRGAADMGSRLTGLGWEAWRLTDVLLGVL